jgi:hypothetical protein
MKHNNTLITHAIAFQEYFCKNQKFLAQIIEHISAIEDGDVLINATGYDHYNEKTKKKTEVKSTNYIRSNTTLRIKNIKNKLGKCDYIKIYDYSKGWDHRRVFKIPSKDFFEKANLVVNGDEFLWSATYNEGDNYQSHNTSFLLKYEINHA